LLLATRICREQNAAAENEGASVSRHIHAHIVLPDWEDFAAHHGGDRWPRMERLDPCSANLMVGQRLFRRLTDQSWDRDRRLADMERMGVAHQVVSPPPVMFCYWARPDQGRAFVRMLHEHMTAFCAKASPSLPTLGKLAAALGIPLASLFLDETQKAVVVRKGAAGHDLRGGGRRWPAALVPLCPAAADRNGHPRNSGRL
jgi:hypothetical protein